jgi:hypothetical protein
MAIQEKIKKLEKEAKAINMLIKVSEVPNFHFLIDLNAQLHTKEYRKKMG